MELMIMIGDDEWMGGGGGGGGEEKREHLKRPRNESDSDITPLEPLAKQPRMVISLVEDSEEDKMEIEEQRAHALQFHQYQGPVYPALKVAEEEKEEKKEEKKEEEAEEMDVSKIPEAPYPEELLEKEDQIVLSEEPPYAPLPKGFQPRPAQKKALHWMRQRMEKVTFTPGFEDRPTCPNRGVRGGIYKGEMGIGKTGLMFLAGLTNAEGITLIVCQKSALSVFHDEWKTHFAPAEKKARPVLFYDKSYMSPAAWRSFNCSVAKRYKIIVTTFSTLTGGAKDEGMPSSSWDYEIKENGDINQRSKWVKDRLYSDVKETPTAFGRRAFFHIRFGTILLDEAQNIRNPKSLTFIAVMSLYGRYKFCLTGTPFTNTSVDIWALYRFCGYQGILTPTDWRKDGLRRYKLDGLGDALLIHSLARDAPEIQLLPLTHVRCDIVLNGTEMAVYKNISTILKRLIDNGDGSTQYAYLLGLLSYLRRSVIAANLITEGASREFIRKQKVDANKLKRKKLQENKAKKAKKAKKHRNSSSSSSSSSSSDSEGSSSSSSSSDSEGSSKSSDPDSEDKKEEEEEEEEEEFASEEKAKFEAEAKEEEAEEKAANDIPEAELLNLVAVEESVETLSTRVKDRKGIAGIYSSTMNEMIRLFLEVIPQDEKVLIYSAFGSALDLVSDTLDTRLPNVKYMLFDGTVKSEDRVATSRMFRDDPSIRVLLVNHKAGGTAHNWQVANNIIVIDTWFNDATLDQIFARAHRPGQTKPVTIYTMHRLDTLDDKLVQMRQKKEAQNAAFFGGRISRAKNSGTMSITAIRNLLR